MAERSPARPERMPDSYEHRAEEAEELARRATGDDVRNACLRTAKLWRELAEVKRQKAQSKADDR